MQWILHFHSYLKCFCFHCNDKREKVEITDTVKGVELKVNDESSRDM